MSDTRVLYVYGILEEASGHAAEGKTRRVAVYIRDYNPLFQSLANEPQEPRIN